MAVLTSRSRLVEALAAVAVSALSGSLGPVGVTAANKLVSLLQEARDRASGERQLRDRVRAAITQWAKSEHIDEEVTDRGLAWAVECVQLAGCQHDLIVRADFDPGKAAGAVLEAVRRRDEYWGTEDEHEVAERAVHATYGALCPELKAEGGVLLAAIRDVRRDLGDRIDQLRDDLLGVAGRRELIKYLEGQIPLWDQSPWLCGRRPSQLERTLEIEDERRRMSPAEALDGVWLLTVLGGPGAGKTWLARRLVREAAEEALGQLRDPRVDPASIELPLFTTVAAWAAQGGVGFEGLIEAALPHDSEERIRKLAVQPGTRVLVVADSLDEGVSVNTARTLLNSLAEVPGRRLVMTSRPEAWRSAVTDLRSKQGTRAGTLTELRYPDDVHAYVTAWFSEEPSTAQHLITQLDRRRELRATATSPLLLTFYCMSTEQQPHQELPQRLRELYDAIIDRLLDGRWATTEEPADRAECRAILRRWAWDGVKDALTPAGLGAWPERITTDDPGNVPRALDHVAPKQEYPRSSCFDRKRVERRFLHRTLWEYVVAEHIATLTPKEAAKALLPHVWFDPDWQVALPMALAAHPSRSKVVERLWCHHSQHPTPAQEIVNSRLEELLLEVAAQTDPADWSKPLRARIHGLRESWAPRHPQLITATAHWTSSNRSVAQTILTTLPKTDPWQVKRLVEALLALNPTKTERTQARHAILTTLPKTTKPWQVQHLVEALLALTPTETERTHIRHTILTTLPKTTKPWQVQELVKALLALTPTETERPQARQTILTTLPTLTNTTDLWQVQPLVGALLALTPTETERTQARQTILTTLNHTTDPRDVKRLVEALLALTPTETERPHTRQTILTTLPNTRPREVNPLIEALLTLTPTKTERPHTRQTILTTLPNTRPWQVQPLIEALLALTPTETERTHTRQTILTTLNH
ncbi:NACHT domain-containing NTPase, partial [Tessaracoccus sp. OH4464_COT-324]|uniref:NACHT domain-containing protein n=1 Tax=Tessaracoccus sp. OH4464_COT-324 TaxID=2491059 RepID=UPI001319E12D